MWAIHWNREIRNRADVRIEVRKKSTYSYFKSRTKKQSFSSTSRVRAESHEAPHIRQSMAVQGIAKQVDSDGRKINRNMISTPTFKRKISKVGSKSKTQLFGSTYIVD